MQQKKNIVLDVRNVSKNYGTDITTTVLSDVSFDIKKGDFVIVTGKSGSGKSTLLYIMSGLEQPTNGVVLYNGKEIGKMKDKELSNLRRTAFGFVFQFYNLIPSITVYDNICLPISFERKLSLEDQSNIKKIMELVGISGLKDRLPYQLSGGQQQRVAIARAIAISPDIIFADEPTGNLDDETGETIMELLQKLNDLFGTTIIMVTHDKDVFAKYGNLNITVQKRKIIQNRKKRG